MKRTPLTYNLFVAPGLSAHVSLNDVPMLPTLMRGSHSVNGGINHRLISGENVVMVQLQLASERVRKTGLGDLKCKWFQLQIAKPRTPTSNEDDYTIIYDLALPDALERDDDQDDRFPVTHLSHFDVEEPMYEVGYLSAPSSEVPCEGTAELHAMVAELHRAFSTGERDRIAELCGLRVEDFAMAFEGLSAASVATQLQELDELMADPPTFAPLEPEELHFHARAGGRVVHVTRTTGAPVLMGRGKDTRYTTDLLLAKRDGEWQVM